MRFSRPLEVRLKSPEKFGGSLDLRLTIWFDDFSILWGEQWGQVFAWQRFACAIFHFVPSLKYRDWFRRFAPRDRGAPAMVETLRGQEGPLRRLDEFTTTARQLIRIRAILWREAGLGNSWWVPKEWHPNPAWVAVIDLCRIQGMGETSRRVVKRWLEANKMRMDGAGQRSQRPDMESRDS
ncbi:hypothetical protein SAMN04488498_12268 [Mesorhizobium albiziae]|uniref:Uncharacterized protein n=1 Tax=Neomesorhizobium albiziae TaxID=335020 RepID=A0A1I4E474_9HYPH|nr:hypothetical protein [Mesorhizobium albiziae]SFL00562.1 hypothetical protein SAMN04488498_12268 [Mesorhizobium albiziae]